MDFDLSTIDEMNNAQNQVPLSMSMHTLVANQPPPVEPHHQQQLVWNPAPDLSTMPLQDVIDMHSGQPPQPQLHHHAVQQQQAHSLHRQLQQMHPSAQQQPQHQQQHVPLAPPQQHTLQTTTAQQQPPRQILGQKRRFDDKDGPDANDQSDLSDDETDDGQVTGPVRLPTISLTEPLEIDPQVVCQMGGLPYADLCKERAREAFKEAKKNEHYANGDHDRLRRRKKNDTSMTPRQKYVRRLRMNQDSAAAARHAQEVYVQVLEKLVKTSEVEKKSFIVEMQQIRSQNELLHRKVNELQDKIEELQDDSNSGLENDETKRNDPAFAKILDMLKGPTYIGAQADMGVQPARAV